MVDTEVKDLEHQKEIWKREQDEIRKLVKQEDTRDWEAATQILVGGLDISFIVGDDTNACACYVVVDSALQLVYSTCRMVRIAAPYIPGFLAFREAEFLCALVKEQQNLKPEVTPDVIMIDGNGILHPNRAGIASHIGVQLAIPTIGVAKNLHFLAEEGGIFQKGELYHSKLAQLTNKGDSFDLATVCGSVLGAGVLTSQLARKPVFVSVGSGLALATAVRLVTRFARHRIPEPTRQADVLSREYLRIHHPTPRQLQPAKKKNKTTRTPTDKLGKLSWNDQSPP